MVDDYDTPKYTQRDVDLLRKTLERQLKEEVLTELLHEDRIKEVRAAVDAMEVTPLEFKRVKPEFRRVAA